MNTSSLSSNPIRLTLTPLVVALSVLVLPVWTAKAEEDSPTPATQYTATTGEVPDAEPAPAPTAEEPPAGTEAPAPSAQEIAVDAAAPASEETPALEEIVVTANRRESSWKDAPAMVTVMDREEIERAPEKTLDDLLKRIPGVAFSRIHAAECGPGRDITLRGISDQKRTLVLIDGIPANDGINGAVNWSQVPKEAVERIEVVRGPMSALYGSGAMGGVINVITRVPKDTNDTTITAGYGSLNSFNASVVQGGMFEKGGYQVSGSLYKTDGYVQAKDAQEYYVKNGRTDFSVMGTGYYKPGSRSTLTLRAGYVNEDYSRGLRTDNQTNEFTNLNLGFEHRTQQDQNLKASLYAQFMDREVDLGARPDYSQHEHTEVDNMKKFGELFEADFKVAGFNTISVGVDTSFAMMDKHNDYALVEREASAKGNQLLTSLFAQDEMAFVSGKHRVFLTPGVRLDYSRTGDGHSIDTNPAPVSTTPVDESYPDRSWVAVNPKLALVYRYGSDTTLRVSAGRSFAAPTLFELYTVFTRGPTLLYGNPALDPESAWSTELGLDQVIVKGLLARATGYYTRGFNFITYRTVDTSIQKADNVSEVQLAGLDGEVRWDITPMWSLYAGYTYNWSSIVKDEAVPANEENRLAFEPAHQARLGVVFSYEKWIVADLSFRYQSERYTGVENTTALDQNFSLDLGLSGRIVDELSWNLTFENMLNTKYDVYSVPNVPAQAPGILINGAVTLHF